MQTRSIGSLSVSVVGVGCNNFGSRLDEARTKEVVTAALDAGITLFDTADTYGGQRSEEFLGRSPRDPARRRRRRHQVRHASPRRRGRRARVRPTCVRGRASDGSARTGSTSTSCTPPTTPSRSPTRWARSTSSCRRARCSKSAARTSPRPRSTRPRRRHGAARGSAASRTSTRSCGARPRTTGFSRPARATTSRSCPTTRSRTGCSPARCVRGEPPPEGTRLAALPEERRGHWLSDELLDRVESIRSIGDAHGASMLSFAFSWLLSHDPVASVIAGATSPAQVRANAGAPVALDPAVLAELDRDRVVAATRPSPRRRAW